MPLLSGCVLSCRDRGNYSHDGQILSSFFVLRPLTWDYSSLHDACSEASRIVKKHCQLLELPSGCHYETSTGQRRQGLWIDLPRTVLHFSYPPIVRYWPQTPLTSQIIYASFKTTNNWRWNLELFNELVFRFGKLSVICVYSGHMSSGPRKDHDAFFNVDSFRSVTSPNSYGPGSCHLIPNNDLWCTYAVSCIVTLFDSVLARIVS